MHFIIIIILQRYYGRLYKKQWLESKGEYREGHSPVAMQLLWTTLIAFCAILTLRMQYSSGFLELIANAKLLVSAFTISLFIATSTHYPWNIISYMYICHMLLWLVSVVGFFQVSLMLSQSNTKEVSIELIFRVIINFLKPSLDFFSIAKTAKMKVVSRPMQKTKNFFLYRMFSC